MEKSGAASGSGSTREAGRSPGRCLAIDCKVSDGGGWGGLRGGVGHGTVLDLREKRSIPKHVQWTLRDSAYPLPAHSRTQPTPQTFGGERSAPVAINCKP